MPRFERRGEKVFIIFEGLGTGRDVVDREATSDDKLNYASEYRQCLAPDEDVPKAPTEEPAPSDNPGPLPPGIPQDPVPEPPLDAPPTP